VSASGLTVRPASGVLVKELDGEAVLLDLASETYFGLNHTAFRMWSALTEGPSLGTAIEELAREYAVEAPVLEADALRLVEELERRGLVRVGRG